MTLEIKNLKENWIESINDALSLFKIEENVEIGILTLEPNTKLPEKGYSAHEGSHEFAFVIEGEVIFGTEDEEEVLKEGEIVYNLPGTKHYTINDTSKQARILWVVSPPL